MDIVEFLRKWHIEMPLGIPEGIHMERVSLIDLGETEEQHFWAQTKVRIVYHLLRKFMSGKHISKFTLLDIGCGNGLLIKYLSEQWPDIHCTGIDGHPFALKLARQRAPCARLILQDFLRMETWSQGEKFNAVALLDVIEHLDFPVPFLRSLHKIVASNGVLVVSVPAFQGLWSERDVFLGHRKRYSKRALIAEMHAAGWKVVHCTYAYSFIFFPVYVLRRIFPLFIHCSGRNMEAAELKVIPLLNDVLLAIGSLESRLLTKWPLPYGTSIFCVAS